jgi:A/G-specific adenine glycosylase
VVRALDDLSSPVVMRQALLVWYEKACRDLPWRRTNDPYAIWVSEVMLQQTQVATVIPFYHAFMTRFPKVDDLANASLDEVLALWQGLGYYQRARNLHRAAGIISRRCDGQLPRDGDALLGLPGIGEYTAGAILSIAYGKRVPALDANAVRVLARVLDLDEPPSRAKARGELEALARALLPNQAPGRLNQGLMELGALVCTAANPTCGICPWEGACRARRRGTILERPVRRARKEVPLKHFAGACIWSDDAILLCRREPQGLLGCLWEIPSTETASDGDKLGAAEGLLQRLGLSDVTLDASGLVRHGYSHFRVRLHLYEGSVKGYAHPVPPWDRCEHVMLRDLKDYGLTGLTVKALDLAGKRGRSED